MIVKETGGSFTPAPVGTHLARCVSLIDIGTREKEYQGKKRQAHEVIIGWELPHELQEKGDAAGKPYQISKFYTYSLGEKANLRRDLQSWRGRAFTDVELKGFDLASVLGKACQVTIIASENGKHIVSSVTGIAKGTVVPEQVSESLLFDLEAFSRTKFDGLSEGLQKLIKGSDEYRSIERGGVSDERGSDDVTDDDVPF